MSARVALLALTLAACTGHVDLSAGGAGDDGGSPGGADAAPMQPPPTTDLEFCVAETNRYRAMDGKPPIAHSPMLEAYATEGAQYDTQAMSAHKHFGDFPGTAFAENECPSFLGWTLKGNVHDTIAECILAFYKEGQGGGHYENMMSDRNGCGCGVYLGSGNEITITQDFR